jgi:hypothetical protein
MRRGNGWKRMLFPLQPSPEEERTVIACYRFSDRCFLYYVSLTLQPDMSNLGPQHVDLHYTFLSRLGTALSWQRVTPCSCSRLNVYDTVQRAVWFGIYYVPVHNLNRNKCTHEPYLFCRDTSRSWKLFTAYLHEAFETCHKGPCRFVTNFAKMLFRFSFKQFLFRGLVGW